MGSYPRQRITGNLGLLGERYLASPYWLSIAELSALKLSIQTTKIDSEGCVYIFVHTYTYICMQQ